MDGEDLGVKLDEAEAGGPVECFPSVEYGDDTGSTNHLGLDFASEGPVEGNDRIVLLGQKRSLDALEGHTGGEDNQDGGGDTAHHHGEGCQHDGFLLHWAQLIESGRVLQVAFEVEDHEQSDGDVDGGLFGESPERGWQDDLLAGVDGRKAAVPFLLARGADDDMGPEHLKTAKDDGGDNGGQGLGDHGTSEQGGQDLEEDVVDEMIGQGDLKTAETSPWASFGDEMPDGGPDLGSDGLGLDVEQLGLGGGRLLLFIGQ